MNKNILILIPAYKPSEALVKLTHELSERGFAVLCVVDGRSDDSQGVRLFQLGEIYQQLGVSVAYNFDGGDSAQSLWNGQKHRTDEERREGGDDQRRLYDIVAIGEVSEK